MCTCSKQKKKRVREIFEPILQRIKDLGSMEPEDLAVLLNDQVKVLPKEFKFKELLIGKITRVLRTNQV